MAMELKALITGSDDPHWLYVTKRVNEFAALPCVKLTSSQVAGFCGQSAAGLDESGLPAWQVQVVVFVDGADAAGFGLLENAHPSLRIVGVLFDPKRKDQPMRQASNLIRAHAKAMGFSRVQVITDRSGMHRHLAQLGYKEFLRAYDIEAEIGKEGT